jgi:hypothetical protein
MENSLFEDHSVGHHQHLMSEGDFRGQDNFNETENYTGMSEDHDEDSQENEESEEDDGAEED